MGASTKILGEGLEASPLWSNSVSVPARWLFICLLLKTDDDGEIRVDEDYQVCAQISGLGIQSSQRALAELERAKLATVCGDTIVVNRVKIYRYRQSKTQAKSTERVRQWRLRNATEKTTPPTTPPDIDSTSTSTVQVSTSTVQEDIWQDREDIPEDKSPVVDDDLIEGETKEEAKAREAKARKETGFNEFWDLYGKKTGTKRALSAWKRLTKKDRAAAMEALPAYIKATPDTQFRKNPATWIHQRCWEDEMVAPQSPVERQNLDEAGEIDF
jgi:hypothetical protein